MCETNRAPNPGNEKAKVHLRGDEVRQSPLVEPRTLTSAFMTAITPQRKVLTHLTTSMSPVIYLAPDPSELYEVKKATPFTAIAVSTSSALSNRWWPGLPVPQLVIEHEWKQLGPPALTFVTVSWKAVLELVQFPTMAGPHGARGIRGGTPTHTHEERALGIPGGGVDVLLRSGVPLNGRDMSRRYGGGHFPRLCNGDREFSSLSRVRGNRTGMVKQEGLKVTWVLH